jgi:hypothetical protein
VIDDALRRLAVFIRLWRRLREHRNAALTFGELADVCRVFDLFQGSTVSPDFIRQLAAFVGLREFLCLPLADPTESPASDAVDANRTHLLALWVGPTHAKWRWAVTTMIDGIEDLAECLRQDLADQPELAKVLTANLDPLSRLAGFDPDTASDTWHAKPTCTLRFAEVLLKIYLSEFTVGEILFLYANIHLDGDDPFALQSENESLDDPFGLPDDEDAYGLWALRRKLLDVAIDDSDAKQWPWSRITATLEDDFGYRPGADDALLAIGQHFFPSILDTEGATVPAELRRFGALIDPNDTAPAMWNSRLTGPFRYDTTAKSLWTRLPLSDEAVAQQLSTLRQLNAKERDAISDLYFAPRTLLARFGLLFDNLDAATAFLVNEPDEHQRFAYFQQQFARFHARCTVIAEHLAAHVRNASPQHDPGIHQEESSRLLRSLFGDENFATSPWENDLGNPPDVTWPQPPTGASLAALLGLTGTGLLGEYAVASTTPVWRETRRPLTAFGAQHNEWNAPVPTIIPSLSLLLTPEQLRFVTVRNGFAMRDEDGEPLRGAQPFTVTWTGALLIEHSGSYRFLAGDPTPDDEAPAHEHCEDHRWRVTLRRGQKTWIILNRDWPGEDAPDWQSAPIDLRRGAYDLTIELQQPQPAFDRPENIRPRHTGFQLKYSGPDTEDTLSAVPRQRLYRTHSDAPLGEGIQASPAAQQYLTARYTSSLRDIRRTYQRAFKAALLSHRLRLSAKPPPGERESELGYLLSDAEGFAGQTHPRTLAGFGTHRTWLDLNLLPVSDPYRPSAADSRSNPSRARQAALFDIWERLYDYTTLRHETWQARGRPAWRLFYEASQRQPDDPAQLVRHLGVNVRHAPKVTRYWSAGGGYTLQTADLETEIWPVRVWRGETWLDRMECCFAVADIDVARPDLWAADAPSEPSNGSSGNENLTKFVQDGCFENDAPRRYADVRALNDALRTRARDALVAWLCGMQRVSIPDQPGAFASSSRDLADVLLQDVDTGTCAVRSRVEDAVASVQTLMQLALLGRVPELPVSPGLAVLWDSGFGTLAQWRCRMQRLLYHENWVDDEEFAKAQHIEAFEFLQAELARAGLSVATPGGLEWWPAGPTPPHPELPWLQHREASRIRMLLPGPLPEGLDLFGTTEADAQPSWLAPLVMTAANGNAGNNKGGEGNGGRDDGGDGNVGNGDVVRHIAADNTNGRASTDRLPLWIQTAVGLGTQFVRVAAAGIPPASAELSVCATEPLDACCSACGEHHEPLVDEYYFWLQDTATFDSVMQQADIGFDTADETSDWHRPDQIPQLLDWKPQPSVRLCWVRQHNGQVGSRSCSTDTLRVEPSGEPQLDFLGRVGDSLTFRVVGGRQEVGHTDTAKPGFRYDLATDTARALPLLAVPGGPAESYPGGLTAYPYFAYVCPGAPIEPQSPFAIAILMARYLAMHCRFDAALRWLELVGRPLHQDNAWTDCARLPLPDNNDNNGNGGNDDHPGANGNRGDGGGGDGGGGDGRGGDAPVLHVRVAAGRQRFRGIFDESRDVTCCETTTFDLDRIRERAVLLRYCETGLELIDKLRCAQTPEADRHAGVILGQLARVLGDRPALVAAADDDAYTVAEFRPRPPRLNPRLTALYDRIANEQNLIHHCANAHRLVDEATDMAFFGDENPGGTCCGCDNCCESCCDAYRFTARMPLADKLVGLASEMAGKVLSAFERGDAEYLAVLRATYERQVNQLTVEVRQLQYRDADWQVQALYKTKESTTERLRYTKNLFDGALNSGERGFVDHTGSAKSYHFGGVELNTVATGCVPIPDFTVGGAGVAGSPLAISQLPIGSKLAQFFSTSAQVVNGLGEIESIDAGLNNQRSIWARRADDWQEQFLKALPIELDQIERQILGAERRRDAALRELNIAEQTLQNSVEALHAQLNKTTSHAFYLALQQATAGLFVRAYELARCEMLAMQRRWNYERGYTKRRFIDTTPINSLHEAIVAADRLKLAAAEIEKAYFDANCRDYELTKQISLRTIFPSAYMQLITTGATEIELPEWLFDRDYPGHYMRRIKNVTLSVYGQITPAAGVHCRLTLLSNRTRIDPRLSQPRETCCVDTCTCASSSRDRDPHCECDCGSSHPDPCCRCAPSADGYVPEPDDDRIVRSYAATEAIATSTGQNDSGLFELNFRDDRYLPFEFAGVVSRWRIELPQETNSFDLINDLNDIFLQMNLTAREGGPLLREAALDAARRHLPADGLRLFDVRRDLPDVWPAVRHPHRRDGRTPWERRFDLRLSGSMFPFVPNSQVSWVDGLEVFIQAPCADPSANVRVRFRPGGHDHHEPDCGCERIDVVCVASSEYPGLYWGFLDLEGRPAGPMQPDTPTWLGSFELPDQLGEVCNLYFIARYCAEPKPSCGTERCCPCHRGAPMSTGVAPAGYTS